MAWHGALTPEALWRGRGDSMARVWVIVVAYLVGAVVCVCAWRHESLASRGSVGESNIWLCAAGVLLLLALDRKLDFLAWVVANGRKMARNNGWYWSHRRLIQKTGTVVMVMAGLGLIVVFGICLRGVAFRHRVAFCASVYLASLIILRAISLHEVDRLLYRTRKFLLGLPLNLVIEPLGILVLALAAIAGCCT